MADRETDVLYKAIANFSQLHEAAIGAIADLDAIKKKEAEVNAASVAGSAKSKVASDTNAKSVKDWVAAEDEATKSVKNHETAQKSDTNAVKDADNAGKSLLKGVTGMASALLTNVKNLLTHKKALDDNTSSSNNFRSSFSSTMSALKNAAPTLEQASKGFDKLGNAIGNVAGKRTGLGGLNIGAVAALITAIISVINPAVAGLGALGAAAIGLVSNLSSLVGVLAVIPSGLAAIASGVGAAAIAFKAAAPAISAGFALGNGSGSAAAYLDALKKLPAAAQTFVKWVVSMQKTWTSFQKQVTQNFFAPFAGNLKNLQVLVQPLIDLFNSAATAIGGFMNNFITLVTSPSFVSGFGSISKSNVSIITDLGDALLDVLDVLKDIAVAGAPLATMFAAGLKATADNLAAITDTGTNDGGFSKWLTGVYNNFELWWGIVKNIGTTLLNYGKAASSFGTWITTGFLKVTQAWQQASEGALAPNSPFKQWLEDIKPLVSEIKTTVGDFFKWLAGTASDQQNISTMINLLKSIDSNVGPALAKVLDTLGKTNIGENIITAIGKIIDLINTILKNGGGQALVAFFDTLESLFSVIASLPAPVIGALTTMFGAMAALSLVGSFTGLTSVIKSLVGLATKEGPLNKIFTGAIKAAARLAPLAAVAGGVAGANDITSGTTKNLSSGVKQLVKTPDNAYNQRVATTKLQGQELQDAAAGVIGIMSILGINSGPLKQFLNQAAKNVNDAVGGTPKKGQKSTVTGGILGAATNNGTGTSAGIFKPENWDNGLKQIEAAWTNTNKSITKFFSSATDTLGTVSKNAFKPIEQAGATLGTWIKNAFTNIENAGNTLHTWIQNSFTNIENAGNTLHTWIQNAFTNIENAGNTLHTWISNAFSTIENAGNTLHNWISNAFSAVENAGNALRSLPGTIGSYFSGIGGKIVGAIKAWIGSIHLPFSTGGMVPQYRAGGGRINYLAGGGKPQPQGTDTVPAMLTPGEYVIRRAVAQAMGLGTLNALNSGNKNVMSAMALAGQAASSLGSMSLSRAPQAVPRATTSNTTNNQGVSIGSLTIHNPKPEPGGQSIAKTLRKTTYLANRPTK